MEHVAIAALDAGPGVDRRAVADALDAEHVAVNYYALAPGEAFSRGMHTHLDQEELFVVLAGTATFETPTGTVTVGAGEAVRFAPGDYQVGRNAGDERVVALAIGAPKESAEVRVARDCPDCGQSALAARRTESELVLVCPDCGTTVDPENET